MWQYYNNDFDPESWATLIITTDTAQKIKFSIRDHSFSTYEKFSEKLILPASYTQ